jgi:flagellin
MAVINTNTYSLNAQRNVAKNDVGLSSALERLSSGLRVNSSKDDAAGLAIGLNMDAYSRTISSRIRISGDVISKNQIADGALASLGDISLRASELEAQKTNANLGATEKGYIDKEIAALNTAAGTIITNATFNGTATVTLSFTSATIGTTGALTSIASARADAGAAINSAEFSIQADRSAYENQMAAKSRIMDADFAEETSRLSRHQVLQQAGMAMISQANAVPQNVLALLR